MISNFIKLILVSLMLCSVVSAKIAFGQTDTPPNPTPEQISAYIELVQDYIQQTKPEFEDIFKFKLAEIGESYNSNSYKSYLYARKMIRLESLKEPEKRNPKFIDPALKDGFNKAYNGSINSTFSYKNGEVALAWADGLPIMISSEAETFQRTMYIPESIDLSSKDIRRLIYHLHVFDGNNGFGISDLVKTTSQDSWVKRTMKSFKRFRKKNFVRGVDVKIVTVDEKGIILKSEISKRPRYLSARYFKEYFGAMNLGRNISRSKLIKAGIFSSISGTLSLISTNAEMAAVMIGLTISSQLYYEGYLTFKYTNSRLMQIIKQISLIAFTGSMYTVFKFGLDADILAWQDMALNTLKASAIFFTAGYAKQLLLESGLTKQELKIIPSLKGKPVKFLGRTFIREGKVKFGGITLDAAKTHDFVLDTMISLGRQLDLVLQLPYVIPGIFAGLHTYSAAIHKYIKKKNLTNASTEMISKEIFYAGYIKQASKALKQAGLKVQKSCNSLLSNKIF